MSSRKDGSLDATAKLDALIGAALRRAVSTAESSPQARRNLLQIAAARQAAAGAAFSVQRNSCSVSWSFWAVCTLRNDPHWSVIR